MHGIIITHPVHGKPLGDYFDMGYALAEVGLELPNYHDKVSYHISPSQWKEMVAGYIAGKPTQSERWLKVWQAQLEKYRVIL